MNRIEDTDKIVSLINNIVILFTTISGLLISIFKEKINIQMLVAFLVVLLAYIFFMSFHLKKMKYMNFVEFLFYNPTHRFTLLPKFRIFLEKYHKINKIHILNFDINYIITKNDDYKNAEIGDLEIEYKMTIKNRNVPKEFNLVFGNDYTKEKPKVCAYLSGIKTIVSFNEFRHSSYERGLVNDATISLANDNLPKKEFELKITMNYKNSFNFTNDPTDTLILLPLMFSNKIDKINYRISLLGFDYPELYVSSNEISSKNAFGNYSIKTLPNKINKNLLCKKTELNNINKESAYFFRISVIDANMEI